MKFEVSVIIPVFNAERFVERAVKSALQFEIVKEILLIEDGSKDHSLEVCKKVQALYPDRIQLIQHEGGINKGAGETRNVGLKNAKSDFVAFLDADDYYLENRFEKDIDVFLKHADADGVYNALKATFEDDNVKQRFLEQGFAEMTTVSGEVAPDELKDVLLGLHLSVKGHFHLDAFTFKRQASQKIDGFTPALKLHQDTEWLIKMAFRCRLYPGELSEPVATRTVHPANRITNHASLKSKALFHQYLLGWMQKEKVEQKYESVIRLRYVQQAVSAEKSKIKKAIKAGSLLLSSRKFLTLRVLKTIAYKIVQ